MINAFAVGDADVALDRAARARRPFGGPIPPRFAILPRRLRRALPDACRCRARRCFLCRVGIAVADERPCQSLGNELPAEVGARRAAGRDDPAVDVLLERDAIDGLVADQLLQSVARRGCAVPGAAARPLAGLADLRRVDAVEPDLQRTDADGVAVDDVGTAGDPDLVGAAGAARARIAIRNPEADLAETLTRHPVAIPVQLAAPGAVGEKPTSLLARRNASARELRAARVPLSDLHQPASDVGASGILRRLHGMGGSRKRQHRQRESACGQVPSHPLFPRTQLRTLACQTRAAYRFGPA